MPWLFERSDLLNTTNTITVKDKILPIVQKYGIKRIILFGSMARGDADEHSDYDFLISKAVCAV